MIYCTLGDEKETGAASKLDGAQESVAVAGGTAQDGALPPAKKPRKKMSTGRKWLCFFLVMTGLYGLWLAVGGFWLPPFTRDTLQEALREKFRTEASVERVTFNPFTFNLVIHNVVIPNPDGNGVLFSCEALDFSPTASGALELAPGLAHAKLINPVIDVTYFGDGRFSFSQALESALATNPEAENTPAPVVENAEPEPLFPFIVTDFELVNGSINYCNAVLDVEHHITDINFLVPFTSTVQSHKERPITPTLSAKINGSLMQIEANTLPFTDDFATTFSIVTDPISLSPFKKYVHDYTEVELVDGSAKILLHFGVRRLRNAEIELGFSGSLFVNNFALQSPTGETVASLQSGEVSIDTFTLAERRLSLDRVALDGLYVKACKGLDGVIDWQAWIADAQKNFEIKNAPKADVPASPQAEENAPAEVNADAVQVAENTAKEEVEKVEEVEEASAFIVEGATIALTNSKIVWRDESLVGDKEIAVTDINIVAPNFNTADDGYIAYDIKFGINNNGLVAIAGDATMNPPTATARVNVTDIPLQVGRPFLGHSLISDVQGLFGAEALVAYGTVILAGDEIVSEDAPHDATTQANVEGQEGPEGLDEQANAVREKVRREILASTSDVPPVIVESASVWVNDFSMGRAGKSDAKAFISFDKVILSGVNIDTTKHRIVADELALKGPSVHTTLNKLNEPMVQTVDGWVKAAEYGASKDKAQSVAETKQSTTPADSGTTDSPFKDWTVQLKAVTMADGRVHADMVRGKNNKVLPMGTFSGMAFKAGPISLDMSKPVDFSFETKWQEKGHVHLAGSVKPDPLDVNMTIKAKQMDLSPFDGLISAQTDLNIAGLLQADMKCRAQIKAKDGTPSIILSGNTSVQNLALKEFGTSDNFFSLRNFDVKNVAIDSEKMAVKIGAVKVDSPYLSIKLDKYAVSNAERAMMPDAAKAKYEAAKAAEKTKKTQDAKKASDMQAASTESETETNAESTVSQPPNMVKFSSFVMDGLTVTGGSALFEDGRYTPAFRLRTSSLNATCSNFSLAAESRSKVNVTAIVGGAPFAMQGTMNPVTIPPFADMTAELENMNLVPMTPYSLEYIAYPIEKGSLTANMAVKTSEWKLDADTEFVLNNFDLGNYDSRPDAPNYPVKLGLSLLRGIDGSVSIDLPVQGRLDDPNFRIGGVVVKVLGNLMLRVVTSPFALLGGILSLASGDDTEDTEIVPFSAGQTALDAVAQRRAQTMIDLLQKRPSLTVRIVGDYDEAQDGHMLCLVRLVQPMKVQKHASLSPREQVATDVDAIIIDPNEYDQFLHERYLAEHGDDGGQANAEAAMASREEMEAFFLKDMTCSPKDLQTLAKARALAVKRHILELAPELNGRVFADGETGTPKPDFDDGHQATQSNQSSQARFILQ